jgi:chromosome segregation ATPase
MAEPRDRRRAALRRLPAAALLLLALPGCPPARDRLARKDVESLQTNVQQIESTLQSRQAGVTEQIRDVREDQARLEGLLEENRRAVKEVSQRVNLLRDGTQEDLARRDRAAQEAAAAAAAQAARVGERLDGLQKGLQTLNDNLVAMSAFERKQEERIAKIQEQFAGQLKVLVEEVGQENQALTKSVGALRADLEEARQEAAGTRQGLVDLQQAMQRIADQLAGAQAQLQELAKRQEALRRAAPAKRPGEHVVRAGETLTGIAARYGVSLPALMERNQLTDANSINEGQKLAIPEP